MNDITALMATMKAAAEKATTLNLDTAQEIRDEDGCIECPACGGEGYVDAERDYCNIDNVALGVQFYGIGEHHGLAEEYFRQVVPANVLALVEALEKTQQRISELEKAASEPVAFIEHSNLEALSRGVGAVYVKNKPELARPVALYAASPALESRTATVKSLTPEVCNALKAEGLADVLRDAAEYAPLTAGQWVTLTKNWHQTFIGLSGDAAGIQVIEGEGQ
ncbi:hypothetical protein [Kluyvera genomosp. 1]|uniref:hypothetical protein n=1 Tax=Kluyvera genomosp. 1 TaxID=2774053 RepID=UPI0006900955|nr:hypothetical protein [Kluyvera genomosp. 1]